MRIYESFINSDLEGFTANEADRYSLIKLV